MTEDSIFLLSSVAKSIVTVAALALVQRGAMPRITIRRLLTHSAGLSYVSWSMGGGPYHPHTTPY